MYGLRQSPRLWQDHYASVMERLGFRRCRSDSNLYCHKSRSLYVLAYVDDLLIVGDAKFKKDAKLKKEFIEALSKELLVKITGELRPNTEHSFLGRKLRRNGDSIDIQKYIEDLLELCSMSKANSVNTTGSTSLKRIEDADVALDAKAHSLFRTTVGKLLWLAFVRPDCSYAVKELSRDVKGPTIESLAKLKHLLRYLAGTKGYVLRIKPTHMLSDWTSSMDIVCYVDSDWAGCSKTRESTSGSTAQVLGCDVIHTSRTQATVALSSGEAELYAIGQGTSEALFLKSLILEAEFAKRVNVIVYTDSTAGRSMAIRFGAGKKTKHVELRYFYMQDLVRSGVLIVRKVHTSANPADVLTKYSPTEVLKNLTPKLGIVDTLHSADLFHLDH